MTVLIMSQSAIHYKLDSLFDLTARQGILCAMENCCCLCLVICDLENKLKALQGTQGICYGLILLPVQIFFEPA